MLKIIGWENEIRGVFRVEKCPNWLQLVRVVDSSNDKAANLYATIHDNQVKYITKQRWMSCLIDPKVSLIAICHYAKDYGI